MNLLKNTHKHCIKYILVILAFSVSSANAKTAITMTDNQVLFFNKAVIEAQKNDPWLTGNEHKQRAIEAMSIMANTLPDPKISLSLVNLPTDGFDFRQEGMTQAKVGISQLFPRGDSLAIKSQQLKIESEVFPYQRIDRAAKVAVTVGSLWLDLYLVQQSIALIEKNRALFEQLVDVATANYSSTLGKTRQQDLVRAQLEQTRLEDRLAQLEQQKSRYQGMLSQWLPTVSWQNTTISEQLPQIDLFKPDIHHSDLNYTNDSFQSQTLTAIFANHPSVVAVETQIKATETGIALAKQKYQAEWGVNASYGYRDNDLMDNSRADLFSIGVTFDLPLFTHNRQDQEVESAIYKTEAIKTEKSLVIRQLLGAFSNAKGRLLGVKNRQRLYEVTLLPQIHNLAKAALSAYTNDDGSFYEVVRARIAVLNAEIDELTLNVEEQKLAIELNYLFVGGIKSGFAQNRLNPINLNLVNLSLINLDNTGTYTELSGENNAQH